MGPYGPEWSFMVLFGPVLSSMIPYGPHAIQYSLQVHLNSPQDSQDICNIAGLVMIATRTQIALDSMC